MEYGDYAFDSRNTRTRRDSTKGRGFSLSNTFAVGKRFSDQPDQPNMVPIEDGDLLTKPNRFIQIGRALETLFYMPTCFIYVHAIHLLYILPIRVIGRAGLVFRNRLLLCVRVSEHPLNLRVSLLFPSSPKLFLWEGSSFEGGLPFEGDSLVPFQKLYLWVSVLGSS